MQNRAFDNIKQYVLLLGGFEDSEKLDLQIGMIIGEILEYCYRKDIPKHMELAVADVIVNELNKINALNGLDGNVTSYREGDMSINYGNVTSASGATIKYNGKLEGFKKIIGAVECLETTNAQ